MWIAWGKITILICECNGEIQFYSIFTLPHSHILVFSCSNLTRALWFGHTPISIFNCPLWTEATTDTLTGAGKWSILVVITGERTGSATTLIHLSIGTCWRSGGYIKTYAYTSFRKGKIILKMVFIEQRSAI